VSDLGDLRAGKFHTLGEVKGKRRRSRKEGRPPIDQVWIPPRQASMKETLDKLREEAGLPPAHEPEDPDYRFPDITKD
jgi:hypothetical protein